MRKSGSPFGLHSHLINGDTFAHNTLSPKILQVYGKIPEISGCESSVDTGMHTPYIQGLDRLQSKVTQLVHGQPAAKAQVSGLPGQTGAAHCSPRFSGAQRPPAGPEGHSAQELRTADSHLPRRAPHPHWHCCPRVSIFTTHTLTRTHFTHTFTPLDYQHSLKVGMYQHPGKFWNPQATATLPDEDFWRWVEIKEIKRCPWGGNVFLWQILFHLCKRCKIR